MCLVGSAMRLVFASTPCKPDLTFARDYPDLVRNQSSGPTLPDILIKVPAIMNLHRAPRRCFVLLASYSFFIFAAQSRPVPTPCWQRLDSCREDPHRPGPHVVIPERLLPTPNFHENPHPPAATHAQIAVQPDRLVATPC